MEGQAHPQNNGTTAGDEVKVDDRAAATPPLPPPPGARARHDTYIVQFPKDQVYRVPPRENALIMEQHRNPPNGKRRRGCCCCCCCPRLLLTIALILVAIIAVVGITLAILFFIFNPTGPTFSITHVAVNENAGPKNSPPPQYEISLRAKNPNERLGIVYENSEVSLLFEQSKVATGKFPRLEQGRDASAQVKVELTGASGPLPKQMAKSMDDGKSNTPVDLGLDMILRVRITAAGLHTWVMKSHVVCKFKVSSLGGNDKQILSQECDTKFKQY